MTQNDIPYVILKGIVSASFYSTPILRTMGDVDFLVHECNLARAGVLLETVGFLPEENKDSIHIGYRRGKSTWEMHRNVNGIPEGVAGDLIRGYLSDMIDTAVEYDDGNGVACVPDCFHHGLVLLLHTASHITSEGVGLRHLCDWAVFVNSLSEKLFLTLFEEKLKACGLWRFAQILTLCCVKYLKMPEKKWAGSAETILLENLIGDIMAGGNFGKKDADRYRQIKYISNRGNHTVDQKSTVRQLLDTIGRKAEAENKSGLEIVAEYAGMVFSGKRKLDTKGTLEQVSERKKLYAELHLFE